MYKTNISYQCQLCSVSIWPSLILFHLDYTACRVTSRHLHNANSAFANSSDAFNNPFCFCSSLCTQWLNKNVFVECFVNLLKIKDWATLFQSWYSSLCTWLKHLRQKCQPQVFQKKKNPFVIPSVESSNSPELNWECQCTAFFIVGLHRDASIE